MLNKNRISACLRWFAGHDIEAYTDDGNIYIKCSEGQEIDILIAEAEAQYRADLYIQEYGIQSVREDANE